MNAFHGVYSALLRWDLQANISTINTIIKAILTYILVKELKDAGFPLRRVIGAKEWHGEKVFFDDDISEKDGKIGFLSPTLPELIESCGEYI